MRAPAKFATSVPFPSTSFDQAAAAFAPTDEEGEEKSKGKSKGARVLFVDASAENYQPALNALMKVTGFDVHQIDLEPLVAERQAESQGNVREIFDQASPGSTILVLNNADCFFDEVAWQERDADPDKHTVVHYLYERMKHYGGMVVLVLNATNATEVIRHVPVDLAVEF